MSTLTPNIGLEKVTSSQTIGELQESMNGSGGNMDILDGKIGPVGATSLQAQVTALSSQLGNKFPMESIGTNTSSISDIASAIQTAFTNGDIPKDGTPYSIKTGTSGWCLFGSASASSANFIGIRADGVYAKFVLTGGVCTGTQLSW